MKLIVGKRWRTCWGLIIVTVGVFGAGCSRASSVPIRPPRQAGQTTTSYGISFTIPAGFFDPGGKGWVQIDGPDQALISTGAIIGYPHDKDTWPAQFCQALADDAKSRVERIDGVQLPQPLDASSTAVCRIGDQVNTAFLANGRVLSVTLTVPSGNFGPYLGPYNNVLTSLRVK